MRRRLVRHFKDGAEALTSELGVRQPLLLVLLLLQNEIHVLANVVIRFSVAHRASTLFVALGERVRRLATPVPSEDTTSEEKLVACQLRFVLLVQGLLLRFRTAVLGALLH